MEIKRIIDISRKIYPGMVLWPGDEGVKINRQMDMAKGDVCNLHSISFGVHTGTHLDAPMHFIEQGASIGELDLARFIGFANVFELDVASFITEEDIKLLDIKEGDIVLFKTKNSSMHEDPFFHKEFVYIDVSAARYLVEKKVRTVGVDYFSVDPFHAPGHPAHTLLLSNNIGVIENLCLGDVTPGQYLLSCLPLRIEGVEGAPVRAVLVEIG